MSVNILIVSFLISACSSAQIPTFLQKCHRKQKDFDECFAAAAQKTMKYLTSPIKELGLARLDPLEIPSLSIGAGTGPVGYTQSYQNFQLYGVSASNCTHSKIDFEKKTLVSRCSTPELKSLFDYEFKGRLLLFPIYGKGPGSVRLMNVTHDLTFQLEEYEKNGHKHFKIVSTSFRVYPGKMIFRLEKLFGNNELLNENLNRVFDDNWEALYEDVGSSYEYAFGRVLEAIFGRMMAKVSVFELFGDE